jgi:hypothetical protein
VSEIESIDGEMEILCVQKRIARRLLSCSSRDLNLQLVMIALRGRRSAATSGEYDARDILADPIAMFFVRT